MQERQSDVSPDDPRKYSGTVLESAEEIRDAIQAVTESKGKADSARSDTVADERSQSKAAEAFRPRHRPTMAVLKAHFDGTNDGQEIGIFSSPFVVGRVDADFIVGNDSEISGRHAELVRVFENGRHYWQLHDLKSTNGTFVRASVSFLKSGQEILLGGRRYRFEIVGGESDEASSVARATGTRKAQQMPVKAARVALASLVEVGDSGQEKTFSVTETEHWIGRDSRLCSIVMNDPMVSPRHARLYRDKQNRWLLANAKSLNGVWLRINRIDLGNTAQFQLGEQRFSIRVP